MFGNQPADRIEPGGEETSDVAAEDNVVVEDHMQIIDDDSQMFQIGVPDRTIVRIVLLKSEKEIFQPSAGQIREESGGTVGIDAAGFSAVTRFSIGNQSHVTGFSTAESIAWKQIAIVKDGTAHGVTQRKIKEGGRQIRTDDFRKSTCICII